MIIPFLFDVYVKKFDHFIKKLYIQQFISLAIDIVRLEDEYLRD